VDRAPKPDDGIERDLLLGWLAFHRDALAAKCEGVAPQDLIRRGLGGSALSLLGLVRHLTEVERVYVVHAIGGEPLEWVYGPYDGGRPARDFDVLDIDVVEPSLTAWQRERAHADRILAAQPSLADRGAGSRRSVRSLLLKVVQEYARHNGHADLLRESIDGVTGE
jgi:hypothetical protein